MRLNAADTLVNQTIINNPLLRVWTRPKANPARNPGWHGKLVWRLSWGLHPVNCWAHLLGTARKAVEPGLIKKNTIKRVAYFSYPLKDHNEPCLTWLTIKLKFDCSPSSGCTNEIKINGWKWMWVDERGWTWIKMNEKGSKTVWSKRPKRLFYLDQKRLDRKLFISIESKSSKSHLNSFISRPERTSHKNIDDTASDVDKSIKEAQERKSHKKS